MSKHPDILPDDMVRKLADLAREHGYGIESLTLNWRTKDIDPPSIGRAIYAPEIVESCWAYGEI